MATGLRERRKQETRQAISDIATHLFVTRGYDEVTISQVADAAGVAKMTVTNYFPRKEDLVFDRAEGIIRQLADVVASRARGESMLGAIRRDYAAAVARADVTVGLATPEFARMVTGSPALVSRGLEMLYAREEALAAAIAADSGTDSVTAHVVAAQLAAVPGCSMPRRCSAAWPGNRARASAPTSPGNRRVPSTCWSPRLGSFGVRR